MDKPQCIFNCDESGVNSRIATREKAYGVRGETSYQEKVHLLFINTLPISNTYFHMYARHLCLLYFFMVGFNNRSHNSNDVCQWKWACPSYILDF